ncbi:MAG: hypothetical protein JXA14_09420 [Anaerolineae bacterium]|nr:hypothetical protein [Anaerolineae bacterium]
MKCLTDALVAEWMLLRRIKLALLSAGALIVLPLGMVLLFTVPSWGELWQPLSVVVPVIQAAIVPANALIVGLVLVFSLGYEFSWGTVRTSVARGVSRSTWLGAKVLAVMVADALVLLVSTALALGLVFGLYWARGMAATPLLWSTGIRSVAGVEIGGLLVALVVAGGVALGSAVTQSPMGGLFLGLLGYAADMGLTLANINLFDERLGATVIGGYSRHLATWNAISLAVVEYNPRSDLAVSAIRLVLYAAMISILAGNVFRQQDLVERT